MRIAICCGVLALILAVTIPFLIAPGESEGSGPVPLPQRASDCDVEIPKVSRFEKRLDQTETGAKEAVQIEVLAKPVPSEQATVSVPLTKTVQATGLKLFGRLLQGENALTENQKQRLEQELEAVQYASAESGSHVSSAEGILGCQRPAQAYLAVVDTIDSVTFRLGLSDVQLGEMLNRRPHLIIYARSVHNPPDFEVDVSRIRASYRLNLLRNLKAMGERFELSCPLERLQAQLLRLAEESSE